MKALEKIKLFFWAASHESLPTKALLHCRDMALSPLCYTCNDRVEDVPKKNDNVEDVLHCLKDCPLYACMWRSLGYNSIAFFHELHTHLWLKNDLRL